MKPPNWGKQNITCPTRYSLHLKNTNPKKNMTLKTLFHYIKHKSSKHHTTTTIFVNDSTSSSSSWDELPLELLRDVLTRIEVSESTWPVRRSVVSAAGVCRKWRGMVKDIVASSDGSGVFTFLNDLKQPGSAGSVTNCYILRNRHTQLYGLFLMDEASNDDTIVPGKFLLAAKRFRRAKCTNFVISSSIKDISEESSTYMGKLRSKFLGTEFTVYDSSTGSYPVSSISYDVNAEGPSIEIPGRMQCVLNSIPGNAIETGLGPTPTEFHLSNVDHFQSHSIVSCGGCMNFSVATSSLKKLQLVTSLENEGGMLENRNVILRYGRVQENVFRLDYQYPISAFQAFAICLSSFDTKLAWSDYQHQVCCTQIYQYFNHLF